MLPDLSGRTNNFVFYAFTNYHNFANCSENLTDEERIWEEILEIKSMPISMAQKKEMKMQLQNSTKLRLQGFEQIKWQRRKMWQQLQVRWTELRAKTELWSNSMKKIEGHFGTGVVAYFLFLRWLMFLNLGIFTLILLLIVLPQLFLMEPKIPLCDESADDVSVACCFETYANTSATSGFFVLDIVKGTGIMEKTLLFYGMYTNQIYGYHPLEPDVPSPSSMYYNLPLAYVLGNAMYLLLSLVAIVKAASREFKDRLVEGEGQFYQYCNLVFGGWDFCIHNEKSAHIKHKALYNEIRAIVHSRRMEVERNNRTREEMLRLVLVRFFINIVVVLILITAVIAIYILFNISMVYIFPQTTQFSIFQIDDLDISNRTMYRPTTDEGFELGAQLEPLFMEFLPYLGIVGMNLLVPLLFNYLVTFEQYSPIFVVKITLLRTVFLRLSSLAVLLSRFYYLVKPKRLANECYNVSWGTPQCWETFIGQQFYKLFLTDFFTHLLVTFFVNFPRAMFAKHVHTNLARWIGEQEFVLSKHVLDIVYSQTLCWLGSFYAPFLPAIAVVLTFLMFYIKKFACLVNSKPSAVLYRASKSNSLFMSILMLSFIIAVIPVVFAVAEVLPSRSCGPFRGLPSAWHAVIYSFLKLPHRLQSLMFFFGTAGFALPCFLVLMLLLYYYYAVSVANKHMVEVLKNQLVLEGHDKQFLLNRLSSFLKQQQDYQNKVRHMEQKSQRERDQRKDMD